MLPHLFLLLTLTLQGVLTLLLCGKSFTQFPLFAGHLLFFVRQSLLLRNQASQFLGQALLILECRTPAT
ncbi:MAG: hypothetical protein ACSLEN_12540 [Candidatus Malihini olakiniferum]